MTFLDTLADSGFSNVMIQVTGESDTGKTKFALQSGARPEETCFLDADVKGRATVQQIRKAGMEFGYYRDLVSETEGMREVDHHNHCLSIIKEIEGLDASKRKVIVWDTFEPFEKTFKPVVMSDSKRFRQYYSTMGPIKGAEEWLASFDYEAEIINRIVNACQLFIAVNHVKGFNVNGKRVEGKVVCDCKKPMIQKSLMRIWVRHNPHGAVPIGLVMKRMGRDMWEDGVGIRTVNVLPRKLTPQPDDRSLWDVIGRYWADPIGNRPPRLDETPDAFELSILEGTLTEDQRMILRAAIQAEAENEELVEIETNELALRVAELKGEGKSLPAIAKELGMAVPEVAKLLAG